MTRLREISPVSERVSYLWPRWYRSEVEEGEGHWRLYDATPAALLSPDRVAQLSVHWSSLPKDQQAGRKRFVTEYQFWMFHTHRLAVSLFWVLQGTTHLIGGTPASFTKREERMLEAQGLDAEPIPPGILPNIPFDESVVRAIQKRDRLIKAGMSLDALAKMDRPDAIKADDELAEQEFRKAFLDWHATEYAPCASFFSWYVKRKEAQHALRNVRPAPLHDVNDVRAHFINSGNAMGATAPRSRVLQIAVK